MMLLLSECCQQIRLSAAARLWRTSAITSGMCAASEAVSHANDHVAALHDADDVAGQTCGEFPIPDRQSMQRCVAMSLDF